MANPTLATLRTEAQQYADAVNDGHKSTAEWTTWINGSAAELYDELVGLYEDWFVTRESGLVSSTSTGIISPSGEMFKLRAVEKLCGGDYLRVEAVPGRERSRFRQHHPLLASSGDLADCVWDLEGQTLYTYPQASWGGTFRLWYVPTYTPMSMDADFLFGGSGTARVVPNQWWRYASLGAAIMAKQKEESDVTTLLGLQQQILARIRGAATGRKPGGARVREISTHRDDYRRWR